LIQALALIEAGQAPEVPQKDELATYAPKIDRTTTRIDWSRDARSVVNQVRAYDPRPGAFTQLGDAEIKLFGAHVATENARAGGKPGEVIGAGAGGLLVACGDPSAAARFTHVQPSGKKRMAAEEWVRGRGIAVGQRFD